MCRWLGELIRAVYEGRKEISQTEEFEAKRHLYQCAACREKVKNAKLVLGRILDESSVGKESPLSAA